MQSPADVTGKRLRCSETGLRAARGLAPKTGLDRLWVELAVRSLGCGALQGDKPLPLRKAEPSWNRIASLLLDPGLSTF